MISNKCYYALKAMLELAKREGGGPVTIGDIADAQKMPARFLESILRQLKQAGFTDSMRGKEGGYYLAKSAREISVGEILRLIEGPLVAVSPFASQDESSSGASHDPFVEVWGSAEEALTAVLDDIRFDDLASKEIERERRHVADYMI